MSQSRTKLVLHLWAIHGKDSSLKLLSKLNGTHQPLSSTINSSPQAPHTPDSATQGLDIEMSAGANKLEKQTYSKGTFYTDGYEHRIYEVIVVAGPTEENLYVRQRKIALYFAGIITRALTLPDYLLKDIFLVADFNLNLTGEDILTCPILFNQIIEQLTNDGLARQLEDNFYPEADGEGDNHDSAASTASESNFNDPAHEISLNDMMHLLPDPAIDKLFPSRPQMSSATASESPPSSSSTASGSVLPLLSPVSSAYCLPPRSPDVISASNLIKGAADAAASFETKTSGSELAVLSGVALVQSRFGSSSDLSALNSPTSWSAAASPLSTPSNNIRRSQLLTKSTLFNIKECKIAMNDPKKLSIAFFIRGSGSASHHASDLSHSISGDTYGLFAENRGRKCTNKDAQQLFPPVNQYVQLVKSHYISKVSTPKPSNNNTPASLSRSLS
jgi:hypothetical protein